MEFKAPETLNDVITDGIFLSAAQDLAFHNALGTISAVEYNFHSLPNAEFLPDVDVDVRITSNTGIHDFKGTRVAVISQDEWTWTTNSTASLDIPELSGTQPYAPWLVDAARTVSAGRPVLIASQGEHLAAVVVDFFETVDWQAAVAHGLGISGPDTDEYRALGALTMALRLEDSPKVSFDGRLISAFPPENGGVDLSDIVSDAHYRAAEQQLFFSGRFPGAQLHIDWDHNAGVLSHPNGAFPAFNVHAHIIATLRQNTFTWAWADEKLTLHPLAASAANVRQFGLDHRVPALLRARTTTDWALTHHLIQATMRILNLWTLATVELNPTTSALVLLSAPELELPPVTPSVRAAVLRVSTPEQVDRRRALSAYEALRGLPS